MPDTHADLITVQETTPKSKTPKVYNFTTMRTDRLHKAGDGLISLIRDNITFATTDLLNETNMLLVEDHLNLFAQYMVYCLDTDNVCHHIITMDHQPREMKETLFTRHNQTGLPFLPNTNK